MLHNDRFSLTSLQLKLAENYLITYLHHGTVSSFPVGWATHQRAKPVDLSGDRIKHGREDVGLNYAPAVTCCRFNVRLVGLLLTTVSHLCVLPSIFHICILHIGL